MRVLLYLHRFFARLWGGEYDRRAARDVVVPLIIPSVLLHREVSTEGVRFYGVCGTCGSHLEASATLCDGCAQGHSRSTPPF